MYFFSAYQGLRQGDCLSPYLFIICMDAMSRLLIQAENSKLLHGVKPAQSGPSISHLFFVDDVLLFLKAKTSELRYAQEILLRFGRVSGQVINPIESSVAFSKNISRSRQCEIANMLQMNTMKFTDRYLGVLLFLNRSKVLSFQPLVEQMQKKLDGWKEKLIPQDGRAIQIQFVLNSVASYQMACFPIPNSILKQLDTLQRRYWLEHHPKNKDLNHRA